VKVHIRFRFTRRSVASTIAGVGLAFASAGCGDDGDSVSTTESSGPSASLTSAAITETDLVVTDCDNDLASGIVLEAIKGSFLLQVDAPAGTGSISYTTGGEEDVGMEGTVDSVTLEGDGSFTVEGSWDGGEAYTLTGSCAGP
jgi:hypothetical protein